MRKIIINLIVIAVAFLFFTLWYQKYIDNSAQTAAVQNEKKHQVQLITTDKGFEYWGVMNRGAADMAILTGVDYRWNAPVQRSTERQIEIIRNAVEQGAEALLVAADDPVLISSAIEEAKAKGVKIIYVDSPADEEAITTLSTDNYKAGVKAGQIMLTILEETGHALGSVGIINLADKANTKLREDGFRDTLERDGRYKLLDTIYTQTDDPAEAQRAAEGLIKENQELVALFGTSEGTSIGVGNAIKGANNQYVGVGFDKSDALLKLLYGGSMNAIIAQNPYTMGYLGMAQALAAIQGRDTGPKYINTGVSVLVNY